MGAALSSFCMPAIVPIFVPISHNPSKKNQSQASCRRKTTHFSQKVPDLIDD